MRFELFRRATLLALALAGSCALAADQAAAPLRQAAAYRELGRHGAASAELRRLLADPAVPAALAAEARGLLGASLLAGGLLDEAQATLAGALAQATDLGRDDLAAMAHNGLGAVAMGQGKFDAAAAAFAQAAALEAQTGALPLARINAARLALDRQAADTARGHAQAAAASLGAAPDSADKTHALLALGRVHLRLAELGADGVEPARALFDAALAAARRADDPRAASHALAYLGQAHAHEGHSDAALSQTRRAVFFAQQAGAPELSFRWNWQAGRLAAAAGHLEQAAGDYRRAMFELQSVRHDLAAYADGRRLALAPLYLELADILLRLAERAAAEAPRQRLLAEARDVVEESKSAELQDYFQDDCVATQQAQVGRIGSSSGGVAVIYPIVLDARVVLLVDSGGALRQYVVAMPARELASRVHRWRSALERRTTRQFLPAAQELYALLMRPLEADLAAAQVDTLVFVPSGVLRTIPLAALHDGKDFLVRRFAVATTPGLFLTDPKPLANGAPDILLNGLTAPVQGFAALPNVAAELDAIRAIYPARVLKDGDYRLAAVASELGAKPYPIVHIASHGQFDSDPKKSFLLTYDGKLTMDALERLIGPGRQRGQPIELLTLSACQTAAGDERAALGLAGVAIKAGARSALASLWFINDQSSSRLVAEFYRRLATPGITKAKALQQAQLALIDDSRFRHPGYWAPFLLIGNWL